MATLVPDDRWIADTLQTSRTERGLDQYCRPPRGGSLALVSVLIVDRYSAEGLSSGDEPEGESGRHGECARPSP